MRGLRYNEDLRDSAFNFLVTGFPRGLSVKGTKREEEFG